MDRRISDEQAQRIWRRAAELQAAAAERAEHRRRTLAGGGDATAEGLSVADVREAAVEAGIGGDFVAAAIAELESERDLIPAPGSLIVRASDKLLDHPPRVLSVTREMSGSPHAVFESMQRVVPNPPFGLVLRDTRGVDLFEDGILVFEVGGGARTSFQRKLGRVAVTHLFVTLRGVRERTDCCDVTIRAPTGRLGLRVLMSGSLTAVGGGTGAAAGAAVGPGLAAVLGAGGIVYTAILGAAAIVTGVAAGGLVLSGYRAIVDHALAAAVDGLESLAQTLAVDVRTRGAFAPRAREPASERIERS